MVILKKVRFKNFRSYGNNFTEIDLNRKRNTLIFAPNGSGKSSILMAIEFALFGKTNNGISKNELVNSINRKDLLVELELQIGKKEFLIRRGIKPNIFEIYINKNLYNQNSTVKDYQEELEKILGFNISSFRQVVSISGSSYTPFLLLSPSQRKKIIEELLDLTIFSKMNMIHQIHINENKEKYSSIEKDLEKLMASLESLKKGLKTVKEQEEDYKKGIQENISKATKRIEEIKKRIETSEKNIQELKKELKIYEEKKQKREDYLSIKKALIEEIEKLEKIVHFLENKEECPFCFQEIREDYKNEILREKNERKENLEYNYEKLRKILKKIEDDLRNFEDVFEKIRILERNIYSDTKRIQDLQNYIFEQKNLLNEKNEGSQKLEFEIKKIAEKIDEKKKERLSILEEKQYFDLISGIIKDNGIKAKIVKQYISKMNKELNKFLEILNVDLSIEIDENFESKIYSRFKDELSYYSFSAGERAKIDIAFLFTWRELAKIKNSLRCNLLFLDEIFDSVLDEQSLETFINLLRFNLKNTNVFYISHRPEFLEKFDGLLQIKKQGNFSKIDA